MKLKVNRNLLPIKAHFFFFFAALGPILPQLNVFGKQLGISPGVMGMVTAVLPLLWAAAKPLFGYVVDFWPTHRKLVFMLLITTMTGSYCGLWFIPTPPEPTTDTPLLEYVYKLNDTVNISVYNKSREDIEQYKCQWTCENKIYDLYISNLTYINTIYIDSVSNETCMFLNMDSVDYTNDGVTCAPKDGCNLICYEPDIENIYETLNNTFVHNSTNNIAPDVDSKNNSVPNSTVKTKRDVENHSTNNMHTIFINKEPLGSKHMASKVVSKEHSTIEEKSDEPDRFYMTGVFWAFVILMCVGTVAFNVANCIGDAVCFDVLGSEKGHKYGSQRAWGTAGYGVTALLGGWLVDLASGGSTFKDFTPAFVLALGATLIDLYSCRALTLPPMSSPDDSGKALRAVLKMPRVLVFITFAVVAGTFDSFIIYYMFWFLEDLALETGYMNMIKLIEGVVVAGQSFIGEILFFALSGRILNRFGYGTTLTVSLFCYGVRMMLISFIRNPWHLVFIESIMQGPTYALCYSTIVGYAARVAPEGYSATVQGVVAGMDDGVGFALGSLVGGQLYGAAGGRGAFRVLAGVAAAAAVLHAVLFKFVTRPDRDAEEKPAELPEEGVKMLPPLDDRNKIYNDTVVPLNGAS